jgi:hypothetical protein
MKKTVTLTNLIKAKNDLEMYIKIDQIKRLKKLFDPTFDLKDLNSKIDRYEDQLIKVKEAIAVANAVNKDESDNTLYYSIYLLSKYNRLKSDLLTLQRRLDTDQFISSSEDLKTNLLKDIKELDEMIAKESDKKTKSEHLSSKNKLKRSLSKLSTSSKAHVDKTSAFIEKELESVETLILQIKDTLSKNNDAVMVDVDMTSEFELVVK